MTLGKYLLSMTIVSLVCWLGWVIVLIKIDPFSAGVFGFVFFYITLFFALVSSLSVLGLVFRLWLVKDQIVIKQVSTALRQGVLFSLLIVGSILMIGLDLFTWLNIVLLIGILAALEFFFLSYSYE